MLSTEGEQCCGNGLNAEQGWQTSTVTGWAWVKEPHSAPKHHQILHTDVVHLGLKALSGTGHSEWWRSQEPKAWQGEVLEGLACPLPLTPQTRPKGHPTTPSQHHRNAKRTTSSALPHLAQSGGSKATQVKRNSAFQT